jgi:hypothetical protein
MKNYFSLKKRENVKQYSGFDLLLSSKPILLEPNSSSQLQSKWQEKSKVMYWIYTVEQEVSESLSSNKDSEKNLSE